MTFFVVHGHNHRHRCKPATTRGFFPHLRKGFIRNHAQFPTTTSILMIGAIEKFQGARELPVSQIGINLRTESHTMHISDANFEPGSEMIMPDGEVHLWR